MLIITRAQIVNLSEAEGPPLFARRVGLSGDAAVAPWQNIPVPAIVRWIGSEQAEE